MRFSRREVIAWVEVPTHCHTRGTAGAKVNEEPTMRQPPRVTNLFIVLR